MLTESVVCAKIVWEKDLKKQPKEVPYGRAREKEKSKNRVYPDFARSRKCYCFRIYLAC
jgi:hypothetical protein